MIVVAIAVVGGSTMAACQRAEDAATRQDTTQERKTGRGATAPATTTSSSDSPEAVTALSAWGNNYFGQLGDGTYGDNRATPVKVGGLRGAEVEALAGGQGHTLALRGDGAVLAWGYNRDGELGNGTNEDSPTLVVVKDSHDPTGHLSSVRAIAAGTSHSLALKEDGTVWAWGYNSDGQLGDGTKANSTRPVRVGKLGGVRAIAAGAFFSLALKEDGTVWAWGSNTSGQDNKQSGQLGDGAIDSSATPLEVGGLGGVEAVAAGASHGLALKNDGTVRAWGDNFFGELGDGSKTDSPTPVRASDLDGVEAVEGGGWFSLALKEDGTVWAWGYNQDGELGNGTATDAKETQCENTSEAGDSQVRSSCANSPTPVRVGGLGGVRAIAAGSSHGLALKDDGSVWAWGANDQGQLGNGTETLGSNTLGTNAPAEVKDLGGVKLIAAGLDYSLAGR